jgi:hypothetical protein
MINIIISASWLGEDDFAFRVNAAKGIGKEEDNNDSLADMAAAFDAIHDGPEGWGKAESHSFHWDKNLLGD